MTDKKGERQVRTSHGRASLIGLGVAMTILVSAIAPATGDPGPSGGGETGTVPACDATTATAIPQPTRAQLRAAGLSRLPVAPEGDRVDLAAPPFSDPTNVTNPLFPISDLHSAVLAGRVSGDPFRTETTLLPETRIIQWSEGQCIEVLVSQYVAYLDGRLEEVALDFYAQADDGSVWYFGEDVFNYNEAGYIADTDGTWLAGKDGPAAMIMPAGPGVEQVFRPENIPGAVFEEVRVTSVTETLDGPHGPVPGGMVGRELHDDGTFSDKIFAPGYGEFYSAHEGDVEALALAIPTDALPGPIPPELRAISDGADVIFDGAGWPAASAAVQAVTTAWDVYRAAGVSPRLGARMDRATSALIAAVDARDLAMARQAAIDVAYAGLDLELRYRPPTKVDLARFELWVRQVLVDSSADDLAGATGDVATLEWIRDRFAHTVRPVDVTRIDTALGELRANVTDGDLSAAGDTAAALREMLAGLP